MTLPVVLDFGQFTRIFKFLGKPRQSKDDLRVKIGVLGASEVATYALIWPARRLADVEIHAVAAREESRAKEYAKKHGINKVHVSYDELLKDPNVEAVYIGLPNGLHGQWAKKALQAGKHVLCEKPFTANAAEARDVQALAKKKNLLCREAFHYKHHPLMRSLQSTVSSGVLGNLEWAEARLVIPKWVFGPLNIRFQENLAGGAMMDAGTYCAHMLRTVTGAEPKVYCAAAKLFAGSSLVDAAMVANLKWDKQLSGKIVTDLQFDCLLPISELKLSGDKGSLSCSGIIMPSLGHKVEITTLDATGKPRTEVQRFYGSGESTYCYQLESFAKDVLSINKNPSKLSREDLAKLEADRKDAISNMELLDSVYTAAKLPLRQPSRP